MNLARSVADIMTREVAVLHEEDNVERILRQMHELKLRHVPVVDGRRLVGLISHHDILRFTVSQLLVDVSGPRTREEYLEQLEENTFVARVMTRDPITVTPQTPIAEAADLLFRANIGCLPVVESGQLVGIVTETDFLGFLVRLLKAETSVSAAEVPHPAAGRPLQRTEARSLDRRPEPASSADRARLAPPARAARGPRP